MPLQFLLSWNDWVTKSIAPTSSFSFRCNWKLSYMLTRRVVYKLYHCVGGRELKVVAAVQKSWTTRVPLDWPFPLDYSPITDYSNHWTVSWNKKGNSDLRRKCTIQRRWQGAFSVRGVKMEEIGRFFRRKHVGRKRRRKLRAKLRATTPFDSLRSSHH